MKIRTLLAAVVLGLSTAAWCAAQEPIAASEIPPAAGEAGHATTTQEHAPAYAHPTLPAEDVWPGVMLIIVAGMFLMAVAAGIVCQCEKPDEEPPSAHGHDDHGHGAHGHDDHGHAAGHAHH